MPDLALTAIHELAMNGGRLTEDTALQLAEALAPVEDDEPGEDDGPESVPDGPASAVLDWVDEDPERAELALAVERDRDRPRKALSASLAEIIEEQEV